MADERDREHIDRPSSDAVKGKKAADPVRATSTDKDEIAPKTDKDEIAPKTIETDLLIEDRFEATDN